MTREQKERRKRLMASVCPFHGLHGGRAALEAHVEHVATTIEDAHRRYEVGKLHEDLMRRIA